MLKIRCDWSTVKSLSLSCLYFRGLALAIMFKRIEIRYWRSQNQGRTLLQFLLANDTDPRIHLSVRDLVVSGYFPFESDEEIDLFLHFLVLEKCNRLVTVR